MYSNNALNNRSSRGIVAFNTRAVWSTVDHSFYLPFMTSLLEEKWDLSYLYKNHCLIYHTDRY